jgi:hypothetical protein
MISKKITYQGYFFLPRKKKKGCYGTLTYDPNEGVKTELIGTLEEVNVFGVGSGHGIDFINGFTVDGKKITLYNSVIVHYSNRWPGMNTTVIRSVFLFVGEYFHSVKQLRFKNITSQYTNMDKWLGNSGATVMQSGEGRKINIKHRLPKSIEFDLGKDLKGEFRFTHFLTKDITAAAIQQNVELVLAAKRKPFNVYSSIRFLRVFQNFLTLAIQEPCYPIRIALTMDYTNASAKKGDVLLFYGFSVEKPVDEDISAYYFLFTYQEIQRSLKKIINKWYEMNNALEPTINLLFGGFYNPSHGVNDFLNMVQSLETYHRRRRKNELVSTRKHQERLDEILRSVPRRYKTWLAQNLPYSNEPRLRKRLKELISSIPNDIARKYFYDKNKYVNEIVSSRNYYTHYDKSLDAMRLKDQDLYYATERLKIILMYSIMQEAGFSKKMLTAIFGNKAERLFNNITVRPPIK